MPKPQLERVDAEAALVRVLQLCQPQPGPAEAAGRPQIDYNLEVGLETRKIPLLIDADPEMLHRSLSNLVLNAIDAMPEGGTLTLSAKALGDRVEIRIADTGLGLAIVQSVVSDHNATIAVESLPGGGTAFVLLFPRAADEASQVS